MPIAASWPTIAAVMNTRAAELYWPRLVERRNLSMGSPDWTDS